jgi:hypothetical protein
MKTFPVQNYDFELLINNKIICKRYFNIRDYNNKCRKSYEIKEMISDLVLTIENQLKLKSIDSLWDSYNPYVSKNVSNVNERNNKNDMFKLNISLDSKIIISGYFDANKYQPKIRYQVDIKPIIPTLMKTIRFYMSISDYELVMAKY